MKTILITIGAVVLLAAGVAIGATTPRFEHIYSQYLDNGTNFSDDFEVYHDKSTGQEVVCVLAGDKWAANSCYLTGRKW